MAYLKFLLNLLIVICLSVPLYGQTVLLENAPVDPDIRMGQLENGITYYIKHNREPEKRASFYIIQNVGAILEEDHQNGLAHFLEHMSFNGTENFPGKAIINSLERHGVAFGYNINAYTSFDETVYNISDVPIVNPGLLDTCLLILHDWSDFVTLNEDEIDLERGVISEEWRTSKTASRRMIFDVIPVILEGSMYAERDIIGSLDVIRNFPYEAIRDFYHDWYRTDLQAIAVVGDIDADLVERKIKELFSSIPAVNDPKPRTEQTIPYHAETRYVLAQDKESPSSSVEVVALHKGVAPENKNLGYIRDQLIIALMNSMTSARISEILQKADPPFISGSIRYGESYARGYDEFSVYATPKSGEEADALRTIYTEAERIRQHGFKATELERAKARLAADYENIYNQKDKISNDTYIASFQEFFLKGEPLTSIDFDYAFFNSILPSITVEEVSGRYRELMIDENRTIVVMGLEGEEIKHITREEALGIINSIRAEATDPYEDQQLASSLIEDEITGSAIVKETALPQFDAVEWTLANNTKVVFRKADHEKDNVSITAYSPGGISQLEDSQVLPAYLLSTLTSMYGVGEYDNITLQKMMAGKKASINFSLTETMEEISGSSTPRDLETMMQLLYLKFTTPRFDETAHNSYMERFIPYVDNMENDPSKIMNDSISLITTDYSPRTIILNRKNLEKVGVNDIRDVYIDRFTGADEFVFFIVGNVEEEIVIPLVEKYIGALPSSGETESYIDRKVGLPEGTLEKEIQMNLTIPKSTVFISFEEKLLYNPYNSLGLSVVNGILDMVYTETIREEEGGTYGVAVSISNRRIPSERAEAYITFDCDPDRSEELKDIVYREIKTITRKGPSREMMDKAVLNILKNREESKLHNVYWSNTLVQYYRTGINYDDPSNYEDILESFTTGDIKKIAKETFKKPNIVDMVFYPGE